MLLSQNDFNTMVAWIVYTTSLLNLFQISLVEQAKKYFADLLFLKVLQIMMINDCGFLHAEMEEYFAVECLQSYANMPMWCFVSRANVLCIW